MIKFGSVASGIEAASVAWEKLGWEAQWLAEVAKFPSLVLKYHYPKTPNLGDMTKLIENETFKKSVIDVLVGGTPCQSFSVAGLRGGLADNRGNLALEYCRLLIAKRPKWFVWENVPGALSSFSNTTDGANMGGSGPGNGREFIETSDFASILSAFQQCGYSCAYRILDAKYFGVPQRRRRVFVVGHFGDDWRPAAKVLFEPKGSRGDIKKVPKSGETASRRNNGSGKNSGQNIASPLTTSATKNRTGDNYIVMASTNANAEIGRGISTTLTCKHEANLITGTFSAGAHPGGFNGQDISSGLFNIDNGGIRRLTPLEWERLQGFPDNYSNIPGASDSVRYKALGNSMAVPVMQWIGERIQAVQDQIDNGRF